MRFLSKISIFFVVFSLIFITPSKAELSNIELDASLISDTGITKSVEKIIFAKVKRQQIFKTSNTKYSQEFAYFFYKLGFKRSPVSYLLFEDGSVTNLNKEWHTQQFNNNLNQGVLFILFVYDQEFELTKFDNSLKTLTSEVKDAVPVVNIDSVNNFEFRDFVIERDETNTSQIIFKNELDTAQIRNYFSDIDFKNKQAAQLSIDGVALSELVNFNTIVKAKLRIKNNSKFDLVLSESNSIQLAFEKDSSFYVNTKWVTPQMPLLIKDGFIKANSTAEYDIELQTPLLPGKTSENISLKIKGQSLDTKPVSMVVKDDGQKVLRIKPTELNYLTIRKDSRVDSTEIGRAPVGNLYLYSELQNNFYKIKFNDKEGWVFSKYVEVLK